MLGVVHKLIDAVFGHYQLPLMTRIRRKKLVINNEQMTFLPWPAPHPPPPSPITTSIDFWTVPNSCDDIELSIHHKYDLTEFSQILELIHSLIRKSWYFYDICVICDNISQQTKTLQDLALGSYHLWLRRTLLAIAIISQQHNIRCIQWCWRIYNTEGFVGIKLHFYETYRWGGVSMIHIFKSLSFE